MKLNRAKKFKGVLAILVLLTGGFYLFSAISVLAQYQEGDQTFPDTPANYYDANLPVDQTYNAGLPLVPNDAPPAVPNAPATNSGGSTQLPNFLGTGTIADLINRVVRYLLLYIVPSFAMIMIVVAGFRFVTAQGNEEKLTQAKKNFVWTIAGVAVIYASSILVGYIRELLGGPNAGLGQAVNRVKTTINMVIYLLFLIVSVYFFWGIIQYVSSGGDEEKLKKGRQHMVWGIIGMAVMAAAWGIVAMIKDYIM